MKRASERLHSGLLRFVFVEYEFLYKQSGSFRSELRKLRFWVVFAFLIGFSFWLGHTVPVKHASNIVWDAIVTSLSPLKQELALADRVRVITITEEDYEEMFGLQSPLNSDRLAGLIAAILNAGAESVFVDIDTSDSKFSTLPRKIAYLWQCLESPSSCLTERYPPEGKPAVWQSELEKLDSVRRQVIWAQGAKKVDGDHFALQPFLGGQPDAGDEAAVASLKPETDGRVRQVLLSFPVDRGRQVQAFYYRAAQSILPEGRGEAADDVAPGEYIAPGFVPFLRSGVLPSTSAGEFLRGLVDLTKKVVFLGGAYSAADQFYTPDGQMHDGVRVIAAISVALAGDKAWHHLEWYSELALKIVLGLVVAWINFRCRPLLALIVVTFALVGVSIFGVLFAVSFGFILDLAALLLALGLEQSVEGALQAEHRLAQSHAH